MEKFIAENVYVIRGGTLNNNSYIIFESDSAFIIDPSFNVRSICEFLDSKKIKNISILITHYHYDHMGQIIELVNLYPNTIIYLGKQEEYYLDKQYSDIYKNLLRLLDNSLFKAKLVYLENELENITLNSLNIKALHTPAHTIGSYTFIYNSLFFTGDFIFYNAIGFLDEKNDGLNLFVKSINNLINYLTTDAMICPGHNEIGKWNELKKVNDELKTYGKVN